jgi:hypothetical protein
MSIGQIATIGGYILTIIAVLAAIRKPLAKVKDLANGQLCMLRNEITTIYYKHSGEGKPALREYERKNLDDLFDGYKALGGNHYIDDIYKEMREWHVIN